ncbi:hypothetical protein evm_000406 [Chilo suppressalis]|nr:hypothetical protein evm_000406 [Chilo suppressalis]
MARAWGLSTRPSAHGTAPRPLRRAIWACPCSSLRRPPSLQDRTTRRGCRHGVRRWLAQLSPCRSARDPPADGRPLLDIGLLKGFPYATPHPVGPPDSLDVVSPSREVYRHCASRCEVHIKASWDPNVHRFAELCSPPIATSAWRRYRVAIRDQLMATYNIIKLHLIFIVFRPTKNKMKLIIVVLCAFVALSAAELKWSEDGQYRLVETDPMFRWVATEPARYRYIDYGAAVPMSYRAMPLVGLRDYEPFVYSYSHIAK